MPDIVVIDLVLISLFVQEIKHVLDGERQGTPSVGGAEYGLKEVVNKLLQGSLDVEKWWQWNEGIVCLEGIKIPLRL